MPTVHKEDPWPRPLLSRHVRRDRATRQEFRRVQVARSSRIAIRIARRWGGNLFLARPRRARPRGGRTNAEQFSGVSGDSFVRGIRLPRHPPAYRGDRKWHRGYHDRSSTSLQPLRFRKEHILPTAGQPFQPANLVHERGELHRFHGRRRVNNVRVRHPAGHLIHAAFFIAG